MQLNCPFKSVERNISVSDESDLPLGTDTRKQVLTTSNEPLEYAAVGGHVVSASTKKA